MCDTGKPVGYSIAIFTSSAKNIDCHYIPKAMSHGAIFLATCDAILLLRDVNLANTRFHYIL